MTCLAIAIAISSSLAQPAAATPAADTLFPTPTVAFFSVTNPNDLQAKWDRTQIGMFTSDASMRPFVNQIRDKLVERFGNIKQRLGMTLGDVTAAAGGEVGVGMLHTPGQRASVAVVIDTTGKTTETEELIAKVDSQLVKRGGVRSKQSYGGVELTLFDLPQTEKRRARQVIYFRNQDALVAVDNLAHARMMVDQFNGERASLANVKPYLETMSRCKAEAKGLTPDVRWYVNPYEWDLARRTLHEEPELADRKDTITILFEQGFDAIRGIGGFINLVVNPQQDILHRTAIYAPPKPGTEGKRAKEKYKLAMRMADLPNREKMPVEKWAPRMTATYTTANLEIQNAFDHVESLFDELSGYEGAFRTTLDSFKDDPYGPEIDVRKQLIEHLGKRITLMTDYTMPITPECERYLFVVEVKSPDLMRSPIDKLMENDGALRREVNGVPYWEIVPEEETLTSGESDDDLPSIDDLPSVDDTGAESDAPGKSGRHDRVLRRAAVCLHGDQLIIASDVEFLRQVLFGVDNRESLAESLDFQTTMQHLGELASPERCSWSFFRTDESIRPSYELIRRGMMPQSQTFFGRMLNEILTTQEDEEQGILRKQRIDGSQLPTFELARRYFGPAARAIRTDDDGWFISGVVLSKAAQ